MNFRLAQLIGWRYFRSSRDFLRSVASVAMLGFAFSIAILVVTQGILTGFEIELRDRVLGILPHVTIQAQSGSMNVNEIEEDLDALAIEYRGSPMIESIALIVVPLKALSEDRSQRQSQLVEATWLTGIDPEKHLLASKLGEFVEYEAISRLKSGSFEMLLGRDKARELAVQPGDFVTVVMREATLTLVGPVPRQKQFRVAGIVDTSTFLDAVTAYIHIDDAARLSRLSKGITSYKLQIDDPFDASRVVDQIRPTVSRSSYKVWAWSSLYGHLSERIVASRNMLVLIFSLMVAIAAFNLVSTVVVFVNERKQDIAVLRTLGGGRVLIGACFLITGIMISTLGLLFGGILGGLIGIGLELGLPVISGAFGVDLLQEYFVKTLNVEFVVADLLVVVVIGLSLSVLAAIYPAWRAFRLDPVEILHRD